MKRIFYTNLILLLMFTPVAFGAEMAVDDLDKPDMPSFVGYATDRIVVKFGSSTTRTMDKSVFSRGRTGIQALDDVGQRLRVKKIRPQFPGAKRRTYKGRVIDLSGWHKIRFDRGVDVQAAVKAYKAMPGVIDAQPVSLHTVQMEPLDQFYDLQWHLRKMKAPQAWDIETGSSNIIVAIPDTGVRYYQTDLGGAAASSANPTATEGNVWINWSEKNGEAGVDDDGNGYVDDWVGWDFVEDTGDPDFWCYPYDFYFMYEDGEDCDRADNDPRDFNGHGTHVAGNLSALSNNGEAVASLSGGWGDETLQPLGNGVKVMPLRIGWSAIYLTWGIEVGVVAMDYAAEALYYAADNGARIASCSWGTEDTGGLGAAIDYFLASGGMIFKGAGNDGTDSPDYMGGRDDIIAVAATDEQDCKADFSDYGSWVDISAPGVDIWSLYHDHFEPETEYVASMSGTSMAAPLAASVAALIWSHEPGLQADQVKQILFQSADPIDSEPCNAAYYTGKLGAGRINAFRALDGEPPPPTSYVSVNNLTTGRYQTTGKGKKKTTTFAETTNFSAGDDVVIRANVIDENGAPVSNAAVNITITAVSGPGNPEFTTNPSDNAGVAEFSWAAGSFEVKVMDVMADGYVWDGNSIQGGFVIQ